MKTANDVDALKKESGVSQVVKKAVLLLVCVLGVSMFAQAALADDHWRVSFYYTIAGPGEASGPVGTSTILNYTLSYRTQLSWVDEPLLFGDPVETVLPGQYFVFSGQPAANCGQFPGGCDNSVFVDVVPKDILDGSAVNGGLSIKVGVPVSVTSEPGSIPFQVPVAFNAPVPYLNTWELKVDDRGQSFNSGIITVPGYEDRTTAAVVTGLGVDSKNLVTNTVPVPELPIGMLIPLGVLLFAGVLWIRRKQVVKA